MSGHVELERRAQLAADALADRYVPSPFPTVAGLRACIRDALVVLDDVAPVVSPRPVRRFPQGWGDH